MNVKKCLEVIVLTNLLMISMTIHQNQLQFNQFASDFDDHSPDFDDHSSDFDNH